MMEINKVSQSHPHSPHAIESEAISSACDTANVEGALFERAHSRAYKDLTGLKPEDEDLLVFLNSLPTKISSVADAEKFLILLQGSRLAMNDLIPSTYGTSRDIVSDFILEGKSETSYVLALAQGRDVFLSHRRSEPGYNILDLTARVQAEQCAEASDVYVRCSRMRQRVDSLTHDLVVKLEKNPDQFRLRNGYSNENISEPDAIALGGQLLSIPSVDIFSSLGNILREEARARYNRKITEDSRYSNSLRNQGTLYMEPRFFQDILVPCTLPFISFFALDTVGFGSASASALMVSAIGSALYSAGAWYVRSVNCDYAREKVEGMIEGCDNPRSPNFIPKNVRHLAIYDVLKQRESK